MAEFFSILSSRFHFEFYGTQRDSHSIITPVTTTTQHLCMLMMIITMNSLFVAHCIRLIKLLAAIDPLLDDGCIGFKLF